MRKLRLREVGHLFKARRGARGGIPEPVLCGDPVLNLFILGTQGDHSLHTCLPGVWSMSLSHGV